ncbi:hypothetical protein AbraIFM66950_010388 [Aspergillus brasiliensis]|nr:hypothetical protein AbraIFM66950_010388 [Aspergillus brasiliensis]
MLLASSTVYAAMQRRGSFCTSQLPCVDDAFDTYFWISRKPNDMGPEIRRTKSADPVFHFLPQVDGPTEQRKAKKSKPKRKNNRKNKNKNKGKAAEVVDNDVVVDDAVAGCDVAKEDHQQKQAEMNGDHRDENVAAATTIATAGAEVKSGNMPPPYSSATEDTSVGEPASSAITNSPVAEMTPAAEAAALKAKIMEAMRLGEVLDRQIEQKRNASAQASSSCREREQRNLQGAVPVMSSTSSTSQRPGSGSVDHISHAYRSQQSPVSEMRAAGNLNSQPSTSHVDCSSEEAVRTSGTRSDEPNSQDDYRAAKDREIQQYCRAHARAPCRFDPSCCVHKPMQDCNCPPRWSCCCSHHKGDCCTCLTYLNTVSAKSDTETPSDISQGVKGGNTVAESNTSGGKKGENDKLKDVEAFSEHLLQLFENRELCDFHFKLTSKNGLYQSAIIPVQVAVIARSPFVAALLRTQLYQQGHREIAVTLGDQVNLIQGFEHAIRNLYGSPLLHGTRLRNEALAVLGYTEESQGMYPFPIRTAMLDLALSYAASGAFLHVNNILEAGIRMALELIDWSTIETIIHFGLRVDRFSIILEGTDTPPGTPRANQARSGHVLVRNRQLREIWAPLLVRAALSFIAESIDDKFVLYHQAQSLCVPNRVPESLQTAPGAIGSEPGSASANSTATTENKPSRETLIASAVLISLPYVHLQEVFRTLSARRVLSNELAQAIMSERESRRLQALRELAKQGEITEQDLPRETKELGFGEYLVFKSVCKQGQGPVTVTTEISLEREWIGCRSPDAKQ